MNLKEIDSRIEELKTQLVENEGRSTEVYSRIVGYYRSVKNWNKGKREEFRLRETYKIHCSPAPISKQENEKPVAKEMTEVKTLPQEEIKEEVPSAAVTEEYQNDLFASEAPAQEKEGIQYRFYFRQDCPNCPPMKEFISTLEIKGDHVDVDQEEGLQQAVTDNVYQAPTVLVLDQDNKEIFRTDNVPGLEEFLSQQPAEVVTA